MELTVIQERQDGRKTYAPALLQVAGVSQFNDRDLRFDGVSGFWRFGDMAARDTGGQVPPVGTIGWFKLAGGNPKRGANARPGSVYLDVESFQRATDEEKTSYTPPSMSPQVSPPPEAWSGSPVTTGGTSVEERILLGMAFNNLTVMLAHSTDDNFREAWQGQFDTWLDEASHGQPLTPIRDSGAVEDAAEIEQQGQQHLADNPAWPVPEQPQQSVDTESLPW